MVAIAATPFAHKQAENKASHNKTTKSQTFVATRHHLDAFLQATRPIASEVGCVSTKGFWYSLSGIGIKPSVGGSGDSLRALLHAWSRVWGEHLIQSGVETLPIDLLSTKENLQKQHLYFQNFNWQKTAQNKKQVAVLVSGLGSVQQSVQNQVFESVFRFCRNGLVPIVFLSKDDSSYTLRGSQKSFAGGVKTADSVGSRYRNAVRAKKASGITRLSANLQKELRDYLSK